MTRDDDPAGQHQRVGGHQALQRGHRGPGSQRRHDGAAGADAGDQQSGGGPEDQADHPDDGDDEAEGDPDGGLAAGTRYADIPDDWACPLCGVGKS